MNKNQKMIDQIGKAFVSIINRAETYTQKEILNHFKLSYMEECIDMLFPDENEFYRTIPTFYFKRWMEKDCAKLRRELDKLCELGLVERCRSSCNSINWSICELEGFKKKYSDKFELNIDES